MNDCIKTLSPRAQRMLSFATWRDEPRKREDVILMFQGLGIEPDESLIELQMCFGGLDYKIRGAETQGWQFYLSTCELKVEAGQLYLKYAIYHRTDQVNYALDTSGQVYICTNLDVREEENNWKPIAISTKILIESDAVLDELCDEWGEGVRTNYAIIQLPITVFHTIVQRFMPPLILLPETSDTFGGWWRNDSIVCGLGTDYSSESANLWHGLVVYGATLGETRRFMAFLIEHGVINKEAYRFYPYPLRPPTILYNGEP